MVQGGDGQARDQSPLFSVIVAVYNDWAMVEGCLQSLTRQTNALSFEVIVVDDGSTEEAPEFIHNPTYLFPLTLIRQTHTGIPSARNRGASISAGPVLLFVDADSRLEICCLAALSSAIERFPQDDCFQLRLVGNCSSLVGRAEELRLSTFQNHTLRPDGRIRYLNTAGFAIRRSKAHIETGVFDPRALRGEDTLLLANLMQAGALPRLVPEAIVEHYIPLSFMECLRKDIRSAGLEAAAYGSIASKGVKIRVTHGERLRLLRSTWKAAGQRSIGRSAWLALVVRQGFKRALSFGYRFRR
jgi:glycosyltransferase involved in cell wall biosynthesis